MGGEAETTSVCKGERQAGNKEPYFYIAKRLFRKESPDGVPAGNLGGDATVETRYRARERRKGGGRKLPVHDLDMKIDQGL